MEPGKLIFKVVRRRNMREQFFIKSVSTKEGLTGYFEDRDQPYHLHVESLRKAIDLRKHASLINFKVEMTFDEKDYFVYFRDDAFHFFNKKLKGNSDSSLERLYRLEASKKLRIEKFKKTMSAKKMERTNQQEQEMNEAPVNAQEFKKKLTNLKLDYDNQVQNIINKIRKEQGQNQSSQDKNHQTSKDNSSMEA